MKKKFKSVRWQETNKIGIGSEWLTTFEYDAKSKEWQGIFTQEEFFRFIRRLTKNKIKILGEQDENTNLKR